MFFRTHRDQYVCVYAKSHFLSFVRVWHVRVAPSSRAQYAKQPARSRAHCLCLVFF